MAKLQEIRNDHSSSTEANLDASSLKPTPHYNMAIMEDMAILSQHEMLSSVLSSHPLLREVIMTAKVLTYCHHANDVNCISGMVIEERASTRARFSGWVLIDYPHHQTLPRGIHHCENVCPGCLHELFELPEYN